MEERDRELGAIKAWEKARLPHNLWLRPLSSKTISQGVAYYHRKLAWFSVMAGKCVQLTLEGAMQHSDVWLNGEHLGGRLGGYLPVVLDLSNRFVRDSDLLVRVDNRDNPLFPPGKPQSEMDFMYGSGLYRRAYLTITNKVHVTDPLSVDRPFGGGVYVTTPVVSPDKAEINVRSDLSAAGCQVEQQLFDHSNRLVAADRALAVDKDLSQTLSVRNPRLWSPDSPYLYRLRTSLLLNGQEIDRVETTVGIRQVEVSREKGFVLNGKPLRLVGTNRHQDYPWVGIALSPEMHCRDALLIKKSGHNLVRLSHYPQDSAFMDACDELGIMTIPCIPGWQFLNKDARFVSRTLRDIRELIRRDRNHPSVVWWEASLNETYPPKAVAESWNDAAHSESLDGRILTAGDGANGAPWDIVYNGWVDADMSRPQDDAPSKPGYIREYGDYEFGGSESSSRVRFAQGAHALLQEAWNHVWSLNRYRPQYPWTMGAGTWVMFDHNVPWDFKVSACGLADLFRRPKPSFWFFQSQSDAHRMVKMFFDPVERSVIAFSNCDEVALLLDGRQIGRQMPERGTARPYASSRPFDGSSSGNLEHPPFVFRNVAFRQGKLEAVGYVKGRRVSADSLRFPGRPAGIRVWIDDLGVRLHPDGSDAVFVRAAIVDLSGTIVDGANPTVTFSLTGDGSLRSESAVPAEMGIASALVSGRHFNVKATALGLSGQCTVN